MLTSNPRKLAVNFMILSGGEGLSKIFSFIAFAYLARLLGPDTYGNIEFALAVTLFFNLAVEGGLGLLGAREIAKDEQSVPMFVFHIVIMRCLLAVVAFLTLMLFVSVSNKSWQEKQLVILYGLTLFGTPGLLQWVFQGLDRMQWVAISSVIRWSFFAGGVFLFIYDPRQVWIVPLIELGAIGCVVVLNFSILQHFFGGFWKRFDVSFGISLLRQALPIGLTQMMWGLKVYLPVIMLGLLIGGKEVGWFGACHRIVLALYTFVGMYFYNLYPSISRCTEQSLESLRQLLKNSIQVTSWAAVFVGASGVLIAEPLIEVVYGSQYSEATMGFRTLIWVVAFSLISGHFSYTLIAFNKQYLEFLSTACAASVNVVLNLLLIPRYGLLGAAWALLCSEAFIWGLGYYFVRRQISVVPFLPHLKKPLLAGAIMTAVILVIHPNSMLMAGMTAFLLYAVCLLILQPKMIHDVRTLFPSKG